MPRAELYLSNVRIGLDLRDRECLDIWMEDDTFGLSRCLSKSSKTLGPTPSDLLDSRECLDIWMDDDDL